MALTPGTRIGVYDITAPLGEGGMGQVWRALGQPQPLFRGLLDEPPHSFDIANAGRRFLVLLTPGTTQGAQGAATEVPVTVVVNWKSGLALSK